MTQIFEPFIFGVPALPPTGGRPVRPIRGQYPGHVVSSDQSEASFPSPQFVAQQIPPQSPSVGHLNTHHHEQSHQDTHHHEHSHPEAHHHEQSHQEAHDDHPGDEHDTLESPAIPPAYEGPAEIVSYHPLPTHPDSPPVSKDVKTSQDYYTYQEHPAFAPEYVSPLAPHVEIQSDGEDGLNFQDTDYPAFAPAYVAPPIPSSAGRSDNTASNSNQEDFETEYVTFETTAEGKQST